MTVLAGVCDVERSRTMRRSGDTALLVKSVGWIVGTDGGTVILDGDATGTESVQRMSALEYNRTTASDECDVTFSMSFGGFSAW
jgi:hypothetical protein